MTGDDFIIGPEDPILVTGATGFVGLRVVEDLLDRGFHKVTCFTRPSSEMAKLKSIADYPGARSRLRFVKGNLLSREDCANAVSDAAVILHLAAGGSDKCYPDAFLNTVVTTRNLLDASLQYKCLRRFVNVSSLAVYSNVHKSHWRLLDESCPVETHPDLRGDAYCFAKVKQDEIVTEYGRKFGIPYVIVRPGYVYGPGRLAISSRVGITTFGLFLHLGGSNLMPFTYVDNCAAAIVLAGLKPGIDGEVFNVIDDDLPSSRQFLSLYKQKVRKFRSLYIPHVVSHTLCCTWERYSNWSEGQLPPVFNNRKWHAYWKKTCYSNDKLKRRVGWMPKVGRAEAFRQYFESCQAGGRGA